MSLLPNAADLLEGNLAARRHTRFVPGGLKYQPIRDVPLKDDFDEWLARVVCFAFSIPPTAFSKQTNRATAESAQESATAEGLQPLLVWLKSLIDRIIGQVLGCDDLEFTWADRTAPDPQTQATIAAAYVGAGIKTRNEVRAELGLDPIAGGDALTTATPAAALPGGMAKAGYREDETRAHGRWATSISATTNAQKNPAAPRTGIAANPKALNHDAKPSPGAGLETEAADSQRPEPTEEHLRNVIFNEIRSLSGDGLSEAATQMAYVVQNRFAHGTTDGTAAATIGAAAAEAIGRPSSADARAFEIARDAAAAAFNGTAPDWTQGALGYNMRPSDETSLNHNYRPALPPLLQYGPFDNSFPTDTLPNRTGVYIDIYGYGRPLRSERRGTD